MLYVVALSIGSVPLAVSAVLLLRWQDVSRLRLGRRLDVNFTTLQRKSGTDEAHRRRRGVEERRRAQARPADAPCDCGAEHLGSEAAEPRRRTPAYDASRRTIRTDGLISRATPLTLRQARTRLSARIAQPRADVW